MILELMKENKRLNDENDNLKDTIRSLQAEQIRLLEKIYRKNEYIVNEFEGE